MWDTRLADMLQAWEQAIQSFLSGDGLTAHDELGRWHSSYQGAGPGSVEDRALPEPYLGRLQPGVARGVFLALIPGRADLVFQGRDGVFAQEIRGLGSYAAWAWTWPYLRDPWIETNEANRHHGSRLRFLRRWFADEALGPERMVGFELSLALDERDRADQGAGGDRARVRARAARRALRRDGLRLRCALVLPAHGARCGGPGRGWVRAGSDTDPWSPTEQPSSGECLAALSSWRRSTWVVRRPLPGKRLTYCAMPSEALVVLESADE